MKITEPAHAHVFFGPLLRARVEEFWIATLDAAKNVTAARCLFRGTVDHCLFHPRDVFRYALLMNASSIVVAHNHPSGDCAPSGADQAVTEQLVLGSLIMEIPLIDHLVITDDAYFSFLAGGRLKVTDSLWIRGRSPGPD